MPGGRARRHRAIRSNVAYGFAIGDIPLLSLARRVSEAMPWHSGVDKGLITVDARVKKIY